MDCAKEISGWSFDDLDGIVRGYNRKFERCEDGVLATLSKRAGRQVVGLDESSLVDTVGRNLREGRFLLPVVGDGIRENVERMVDDFLSKAPLLRFTRALVELQLFRTVDRPGGTAPSHSPSGRKDQGNPAYRDYSQD